MTEQNSWLTSDKPDIVETAVTTHLSSAIQDCLKVISKRFTPEECEAIVTNAVLRCLGSEHSKAVKAWVKAVHKERKANHE